jgi:hypothetical protein
MAWARRWPGARSVVLPAARSPGTSVRQFPLLVGAAVAGADLQRVSSVTLYLGSSRHLRDTGFTRLPLRACHRWLASAVHVHSSTGTLLVLVAVDVHALAVDADSPRHSDCPVLHGTAVAVHITIFVSFPLESLLSSTHLVVRYLEMIGPVRRVPGVMTAGVLTGVASCGVGARQRCCRCRWQGP